MRPRTNVLAARTASCCNLLCCNLLRRWFLGVQPLSARRVMSTSTSYAVYGVAQPLLRPRSPSLLMRVKRGQLCVGVSSSMFSVLSL